MSATRAAMSFSVFWQRLYIQVSASRIKVLSLKTDRVYDAPPLVAIGAETGKFKIVAAGRDAQLLQRDQSLNVVNPFAHPRTIIGDFTVAEKLIEHAIREVTKGCWFAPFKEAIIHPEGDFEGGLTQIEYRALNELCLVAGCRRHTVYEGRPLTRSEVANVDIKGASYYPHNAN